MSRVFQTAGSSVATLLAVAVAGFMSSDRPPLPESIMPVTAADQAADQMKAQRYAMAAALWRQAAVEGGDPELCLGRLAECQYRDGRLQEALTTCEELEWRVNDSANAAFVRGLVLKQQRKSQEAKKSFELAFLRRHPQAAAQIERLATP